MLPPAILWIDPGGQTGLAYLTIAGQQEGYKFGAEEKPFQDACRFIDMWCQGWGPSLAIGWERFTVTRNTHKLTPQPEAMHVIGVCRYLAARYGCRVLPEAQQASPGQLEQKELKALGWWVPSKNDAQSAASHLLRWLRQSGELPPREREILDALGRQEKEDGDSQNDYPHHAGRGSEQLPSQTRR